MDRVDEYRRVIKEILSRHAKIKYLKEGKDMEAISGYGQNENILVTVPVTHDNYVS
jgi:hypothetical protein